MAEKQSDLRATATDDRFTATYVYLCLACFLVVAFSNELDRLFNLWLLLIPLLLLPLGLLFFALPSSVIWNAMRGSWRRAVSAAASPFLAATPLILCYQLGITPTWLSFQLARPYFEWEVARAATTDKSLHLRAFAWGETGGVAVANIFYTLIFDESDEIGLPPDRRSASWLLRAKREPRLYSILEEQGIPNVRRLASHWYMVTQVYQ